MRRVDRLHSNRLSDGQVRNDGTVFSVRLIAIKIIKEEQYFITLLAIKKQVMNTKKLSITIGIILAVAFFASLIAALSSEEENENKLKAGTEKEYNCTTRHEGDHFKKGHKPCCKPDKCREMKCDTSMCKHMGEKCAMAKEKCNPSECPYHDDKFLKGEKIPSSLLDDNIWKNRYKDIRNYEKYLTNNGSVILKFFLHLSREVNLKSTFKNQSLLISV